MTPLDNLRRYSVVLASNSPRRKELFSALGVEFSVRVIGGIGEGYPAGLSPVAVAEYISREKAAAYLPTMAADELIITADTVVAVDGDILGKPSGADEASAMLHRLSGRTHQVVTGVTLTTTERRETFAAESDVTFAALTDDEISYYIERFRPFDKAGSYGIQEWIGMIGITRLEGSYFNVMGLPLQRLYTALKSF